MAGKLHPKQIAQAGATNGQVLTYDTGVAQWIPGNGMVGFGFKSGVALAASFSGSPKSAVVTFATPYASTNYAVTLGEVAASGSPSHAASISDKLTTGFTINLNSASMTGFVGMDWHTALYGEQ